MLLTWTFGVIVIKFTSFQKRFQQFYSYNPHERQPLPAIMEFICRAYNELTPLGFQLTAYLCQEGGTAGMRLYVTMFNNSTTGDRAMAVTMQTPLQSIASARKSYVEFTTDYLDEVEVNTNNSKTPLGTFYRKRTKFGFQYARQKNVTELYRYHRALLGIYGSKTTMPRQFHPAYTVAELQLGMGKDLDYQAGRGLYWLSEDGQTYRPTWLGAMRMVFLLMFPIVQFRKLLRRRRVEEGAGPCSGCGPRRLIAPCAGGAVPAEESASRITPVGLKPSQ